jgi:class 3 adenylate cyclase
MGLHTGEPLISSTGYIGMDIHRAARIGDAGHGGQILLSQTTRELVIQDLPQGMTIRDLGEHRPRNIRIHYQLVIRIASRFCAHRPNSPVPNFPRGEAPFRLRFMWMTRLVL